MLHARTHIQMGPHLGNLAELSSAQPMQSLTSLLSSWKIMDVFRSTWSMHCWMVSPPTTQCRPWRLSERNMLVSESCRAVRETGLVITRHRSWLEIELGSPDSKHRALATAPHHVDFIHNRIIYSPHPATKKNKFLQEDGLIFKQTR